MDADLKARWVEALRSGKYKQGTGRLRNISDTYCCLGVLADVDGVNWARGMSSYQAGHDGHSAVYGRHLMDCQDIDHLIALNDSGKSFMKIADWIEANV